MDKYKKYIKLKTRYNRKLSERFESKKKGKRVKENVQCVNCRSPFGMIFNDDGVNFEVKCGNTKKPCDVNKYSFILPKYVNVLSRKRKINKELNGILGEIKNMKVRIIYTGDENINKDDIQLFATLKTKALNLIRENKQLRKYMEENQYHENFEDIDIIPDDFMHERLEFYETNKMKLRDYYIFKRPNIEVDQKTGNISFPNQKDNITTLISNPDLLFMEIDDTNIHS